MLTVDLAMPIYGLICDLPPTRIEGVPVVWKKADRERWLKAFEAALDLVYPSPASLPAPTTSAPQP